MSQCSILELGSTSLIDIADWGKAGNGTGIGMWRVWRVCGVCVACVWLCVFVCVCVCLCVFVCGYECGQQRHNEHITT